MVFSQRYIVGYLIAAVFLISHMPFYQRNDDVTLSLLAEAFGVHYKSFNSHKWTLNKFRFTPSKGKRTPTATIFRYSNSIGEEFDRPLSTLVEIPDFSLAPTPEDYIPLEDDQRLICLGDVHGDFNALVDFLELAGVLEMPNKQEKTSPLNTASEKQVDDEEGSNNEPKMDTAPRWVGNNTILVQCGDVLDRGSDELACFNLLAQLSHQAEEVGGKVVLLYGNHEAMNALGMFQYATTDKEYEHVVGKLVDQQLSIKLGEDVSGLPMWRTQYVGNQPARWACFEPRGLLTRSLMANMKVAVQVGRTVCVHAGLTKEHLTENGGISGLNEKARAYILGETLGSNITYNNRGDYPNFRQPLIDAEHRQTTYINSIPSFLSGGIGASSPLWMRDYSSPADGPPNNPMAMKMIDDALAEVGECDRMVMGHTVQSRINSALDGKAWRVDVGASRGVVAGTPEVLEVKNVNGTEEVSVLTKATKGGRLAGVERQITALVGFF